MLFSLHSEGKGAKKILIMITSNIALSFIEAFKIYAKRWTTEVMYKETKQLLHIQGCQSTSLAHQHAMNEYLKTHNINNHAKKRTNTKTDKKTINSIFRMSRILLFQTS